MPELETSIVWLGAIAGALSSVAALLSLAFKPFLKLKERVADLEEEVRALKDELAEHQEKLNKDHHSFLKKRINLSSSFINVHSFQDIENPVSPVFSFSDLSWLEPLQHRWIFNLG